MNLCLFCLLERNSSFLVWSAMLEVKWCSLHDKWEAQADLYHPQPERFLAQLLMLMTFVQWGRRRLLLPGGSRSLLFQPLRQQGNESLFILLVREELFLLGLKCHAGSEVHCYTNCATWSPHMSTVLGAWCVTVLIKHNNWDMWRWVVHVLLRITTTNCINCINCINCFNCINCKPPPQTLPPVYFAV